MVLYHENTRDLLSGEKLMPVSGQAAATWKLGSF